LQKATRDDLVQLAVRVGRRTGVDVVAHNFYSPIPAWDELPEGFFDRRSPLRGITFDVDAQVAYLRSLESSLAEFEPPDGFSWGNGMYDLVEADVLYALVRAHAPKRIIELGSGFSSLIIAAAAGRNSRDGHEPRYTIYDPFARDFIRRGVPGAELRTVTAAAVPLDDLQALEAGDILFIDTTHTVKLGSEVNYLMLDVLPTLAPGVLVHVHDIFLPYEYPRSFFGRRLYWNEQYLLQAFLAQNADWKILLPLFALVRDRPDDVASLVRSFTPNCGPGAFWIRRTGSS